MASHERSKGECLPAMSDLLKETAALAASAGSFAAMKLENLAEFPEEILLQVFGQLSAEDLVHVAQVSTRWRYVSSSDDLWRRLCNRKWHSSEYASLRLLCTVIVPPVLEGNAATSIGIIEQSIEPRTSQSGEEAVLASQTKETTGQGDTSASGVHVIESGSASPPAVVSTLVKCDRKDAESDGGKMRRVTWKEVYRQRLEFEAEARTLVDDMVWPLLRPRSLQRLVELRSLVTEELERLAEKDDVLSEGTRYFALEALYRVHRQTCVDDIKQFLALTQQEMEDQIASGALIIARLRYRNLNVDAVEKQLDDIAAILQRRINSDSEIANHGGIHTPLGRLSAVKQLNYLLFGRGNETNEGVDPECLHLEGNRENYYSPRNSYLNDVLESRRGIPISLAIVHASVGRKCSIPIEMVGIPMHFLTKVGEPEAPEERFIDVFDGGHLLLREECVELVRSTGLPFHPHHLDQVTPPRVLVRMCNNLLAIYGQKHWLGRLIGVGQREADTEGRLNQRDKQRMVIALLDILLTINPNDTAERFHRVKQLMASHEYEAALEDLRILMQVAGLSQSGVAALEGIHHELLSQYMERAQELQREHEERCVERRIRKSSSLKFGVGTIVRDVRRGYRGVIYGWDTICNATDNWIMSMQVDRLRHGRSQPFYRILVDERDKRPSQSSYVAQELLALSPEVGPISHEEIGAYFLGFRGGRYIPNAFLQFQYPDDIVLTDHDTRGHGGRKRGGGEDKGGGGGQSSGSNQYGSGKSGSGTNIGLRDVSRENASSSHAGESSSRGGESSSRGGEPSARGGETSSREGDTSLRGGETSSSEGEASPSQEISFRGGEISSRGGEISTRGGEISSRVVTSSRGGAPSLTGKNLQVLVEGIYLRMTSSQEEGLT